MSDRERPPLGKWYYRRIERISRAVDRYLLLLLLIGVYSIGTFLSGGQSVEVPILGLGPMDKSLVHLALVTAGSLIVLAVLGAWQARNREYEQLSKEYMRQLSGAGPDFNFLDALVAAGYRWDEPLIGGERWGYIFIGSVPVLAVAWFLFLYLTVVVCLGRTCEWEWGLVAAGVISGVTLVLAGLRLIPFLRGQRDMWEHGHVIDRTGSDSGG